MYLEDMVSPRTISDIEYLASHCWPGKEIERYKGWIIHWNDAVTWRANSVLPIGEPSVILEDAIDYVIKFYEERSTPAAFKMTEESKPENLEETLEEMGFVKFMNTYLQTIPIDVLVCLDPRVGVDLLRVTDESIDTLIHRSKRTEFELEIRREIIHRIEGEKKIARVMIDGQIAGVGLGVVEEDMLGLFSVRTLPEYQHRGVAWSISCALGMWGEETGASTAFLQVEADNIPALELYDSMGFKTQYTYWYRILGEGFSESQYEYSC
ncbi:MAG: GNAT family N-acetyltransferase [Candidatus Thorarchaeota archaeon]|nr:GNAT family N-acetyltransferase [Candidatus Thorarchaeota archaeon]